MINGTLQHRLTLQKEKRKKKAYILSSFFLLPFDGWDYGEIVYL